MKEIECEIIEVQDYPIPGIVFKDLTPVWKNQDLFNILIDKMFNFHIINFDKNIVPYQLRQDCLRSYRILTYFKPTV